MDFRSWTGEKRRTFFRKYLPTENGEVKGKRLSEKDIAKLMPILRHHDVIFEVAAIDLGIHTEEGIRRNQAGRAEGMTANLTEEHHQTMVDAIWKARRELESYSLQLNIQSAIIFELIRTVIEHGTMYYCQRRPEELANFHWVIDAKGDNSIPTPWEKWWTTIIKPALQTKFAHNPIGSLKIGDYSHMKRFVFDEVSEFHRKILTRISHRDKRIGAANQRKLFCENDFSMIRRKPRCRQSVAQNGLILESLKGGLWTQRSMPGW